MGIFAAFCFKDYRIDFNFWDVDLFGFNPFAEKVNCWANTITRVSVSFPKRGKLVRCELEYLIKASGVMISRRVGILVVLLNIAFSGHAAADFIPFEIDSPAVTGSFNYDDDGPYVDGTPRGYAEVNIVDADGWLDGLFWYAADNRWSKVLKSTNNEGDFLRLRFDSALTTVGLNQSVGFEGLIDMTSVPGMTVVATFTGSVTNVSEPGTLALLVVGLAGLVAARRRSGVRV